MLKALFQQYFATHNQRKKLKHQKKSRKKTKAVRLLIAGTSNDNESDLHLQQETSNEFRHESSTDMNPVTVPL